MQNIDAFSYQCGVIDCFNEMVHAGLKTLALSRPMDSSQERDELIPFARESCQRYGNQLYIEDEPLLTDLFPVSMNLGKHNMLFYRADHILDQYLRQTNTLKLLKIIGEFELSKPSFSSVSTISTVHGRSRTAGFSPFRTSN